MFLYLVVELIDFGGFVEESGFGIYWGEVNEGEFMNLLVEFLFKNGLVFLKCNFVHYHWAEKLQTFWSSKNDFWYLACPFKRFAKQKYQITNKIKN